MGRRFITRAGRRTGAIVFFTVLCLLFPDHSFAWGRNGQRLVVNQAIDTLEALPPEFRGFFESSRALLPQHVTAPHHAIAKSPTHRRHHFTLLANYGRFPCEALPRSAKPPVPNFATRQLLAN